jgi:hypothetical protein
MVCGLGTEMIAPGLSPHHSVTKIPGRREYVRIFFFALSFCIEEMFQYNGLLDQNSQKCTHSVSNEIIISNLIVGWLAGGEWRLGISNSTR